MLWCLRVCPPLGPWTVWTKDFSLESISRSFFLLKVWIFVRIFFLPIRIFLILPKSPRQTFLFWQTGLLCIGGELTGVWSLSVAVGVPVAVAMGFICFCVIIRTYQEIQWSTVWSDFFYWCCCLHTSRGYVVSGGYNTRKNNFLYCDLDWSWLILVDLGISRFNLLFYFYII